jgi:hypothetical protein
VNEGQTEEVGPSYEGDDVVRDKIYFQFGLLCDRISLIIKRTRSWGVPGLRFELEGDMMASWKDSMTEVLKYVVRGNRSAFFRKSDMYYYMYIKLHDLV